jgi:hypothetical protein
MGWELLDVALDQGRYTYGYFAEGRLQAIRVDVPTTALEQLAFENGEAEKLTHGQKLPDWNRVASIPLPLLTQTGLDTAIQMGDDKYVSRVLNDSDNSKFRTSRGRV